MSLLNQISGVAGLGSLLLSKPAALVRAGVTHDVMAMRRQTQKPYRATENGKPYDAQVRVDAGSSPTEPLQNDTIVVDGETWTVWRVSTSPAGSHWTLDCMAPATVAVIPLRRVETSDGQGGKTLGWQELLANLFYVKVREGSRDRQLSAESESQMGRLFMSYRADEAPAGFNSTYRVRLSTEAEPYQILSITVDDENPMWHNAVLAREVTL